MCSATRTWCGTTVPNWSSIEKAHREDPELVEAMLIEGVAVTAAMAAESIGRLIAAGRKVPEALEHLKAYENPPSASFTLKQAETLFQVTGDPVHRSTMLDVLVGRNHWVFGIDAAMAVGKLEPSLEANDALEISAASEDYLVRYHSADALLKYAGAIADAAQHPFFKKLASPGIKDKPTKKDRAGWHEVAVKLAAKARKTLEAPPATQ